MAIIRKGAMGDISGRIGDTVYRVRNHKNIGCKRPTSQKISQTEDSVKNRSKFAFTIQFAKIINSNPELLSCWKSAEIKGTSGFQRIIKHNSKNVSAFGITSKNIITPPGFKIYKNLMSLELPNIVFKLNIEDQSQKAPFKFYALLCLNNEQGSELMLVKSDGLSIIKEDEIEGKIELCPEIIEKLKTTEKVLLLSTLTSSSEKFFWSSTIPFEQTLII